VDVITIDDGFKWIMRGDVSHTRKLSIEEVSRIHFRGGSYIGVSRDNPTTDPVFLERTINSLLRLNIDKLITIGGDDTAYSALMLEAKAQGRISVVHVPKTIDNDLDLPLGINTFGFQTARHYGVNLVENLMEDALTTTRWYFAITMGRAAGHLAMGIGKATGATITLIPEEFHDRYKLTIQKLVDILVGSIIKRLSVGRKYGVAVIAEGLVDAMTHGDIPELEHAEMDDHGNLRIAEIDFGGILKKMVQARLAEFNIKTTIVAKNIGYELRCADPIPFDMEYSRDLGYCAAKFILEGGNRALASMQYGKFVPLYFEKIVDPSTGRPRIRMVDVKSEFYEIARQYMIRLNQDDFADPHELAKYAATAGISLPEFEKQFKYIVQHDFAPHSVYCRPEKDVKVVKSDKKK
ncbi:MAG: 6-phosphofructokinase, partial [Calditrichaeota bacterium]|nr:6-phosphofructokinase [Calditrichota bacterium]